MNRKLIYSLIGVLVSGAVLSGCGGDTATNNEEVKKETKPALSEDTAKNGREIIFEGDTSLNPANSAARKDTFIAGIANPGGVFLPYFYDNCWDGNATAPIFESLIDQDGEGKPEGRLAESWEISEDNLVYTFKIRDNAKFSDGTDVTAADVAFTLYLLHDPAYVGGMDLEESYIKGSKEYKEQKSDKIEGIKVIDDKNIEITTTAVNSQNLYILGGSVLSKDYYGKDYKWGELDYLKPLYGKPLGAGQYKFVKYVPGQEIQYVANEHFYGGKPKVEKLIYKVLGKNTAFQELQNGDLDYAGFTASDEEIEELKALGFVDIELSTRNNFSFMYMNSNNAQLKDTKTRQALNYGLDREKVNAIKYKGYGEVAHVPTSPLSWAYTEEGVTKYEYNPEKAKALLDEAGWKDSDGDGIRDKDGEDFALDYITTKGDDEMVTILKENYSELGIEINVEMMDSNALFARLNQKDYDFVTLSTPMLSDPNSGVARFGSDNESLGYKNDKVDELLKKSISVVDIEERKAIYEELFKELTADPAAILLSYSKGVAAYNSKLENFEISSYTGISAKLNEIEIK